jgi:O-antigen/teichoic acid export membrane protein
MLVTFGMDTLLTKEIARRPERAADLFASTIVLRVLLFTLAFAAISAYLNVFHYPAETVGVVWIIGLSTLFWNLSAACQATLQGLERMGFMTLGNVLGKVVNTVGAIALLLLGQGVNAVAWVIVLAALVTFAMQLRQVTRLYPLRPPKGGFGWSAGKDMLRAGLPYLFSGLFLVLYAQADVVIISLLVDEKTIGWYGAAGQLFTTLMFIPNVFITAVFPALSRMYTNAAGALPKLMRKSFDWLMLLSVPIGLGLCIIADPLVVLLFGPEFEQSGPVLSLMGLVLILTYQNMLLGRFLVSTDRQAVWARVMLAAVIVTVGLDFVLVPWCSRVFGNGGIGGSLSFIVTELGMFVFGVRHLPNGSLGRANAWTAARIWVAGLVMMGVTWWLRSAMIVFPVLAGAFVYAAMIVLLRVVPAEDWAVLWSAVRGLRSRLSARMPRLAQGGR